MPHVNGYSIYVAPVEGEGWRASVYRDSDDTRVLVVEPAPLTTVLDRARRALLNDLPKVAT